jgi:RNA polymerase sigma factor (sigma-70 family)
MHDAHTLRDDSILLLRWVRDGSEEAFAELVHGYERLVLGAALRRTGDAELARDVAQQVFATLATKARLLIGRKNLAGWLYCAASHIAARAAQREARRRRKQEALGESAELNPSAPQQWPVVEEALASLAAKERESLILHYFQDLSYPQIAALLGIEEAAARKRVSRALQRLEAQMRKRGLGISATGFLAAVAAQQLSIATEASLAPLAMVGGSVAVGSASAATSTTLPLAMMISTVMSHTPLKIAACTIAIVVAPLVWQTRANATLRTQLMELRGKQTFAPRPQTDLTSLQQEHARLRNALAAKHTARIAEENRAAALGTFEKKLTDEVVISFGTVDTMARKLAKVVALMEKLDPSDKSAPEKEPLSNEERARIANEVSQAIPEMMSLVREVPKLEREPAKAGRFYATMLGEIWKCDDATRTAIEPQIAHWVERLQADGLTLVQRPRGKASDWDTRRNAATDELLAGLAATVPAEKRAGLPLDQIFRGGIDPGIYEFLTASNDP